MSIQRWRRPRSPLQFQNTSDTYREIGHRDAKFERRGPVRAAYGERLRKRFADDLIARRGFSRSDIALMRASYLQYEIFQTASGKGLTRDAPANSDTRTIHACVTGVGSLADNRR
jgi:hypothetical protein